MRDKEDDTGTMRISVDGYSFAYNMDVKRIVVRDSNNEEVDVVKDIEFKDYVGFVYWVDRYRLIKMSQIKGVVK